jgi:glycerol uptake facilitator-like aquaporin
MQILGAMVGVLLYQYINDFMTKTDIQSIKNIGVSSIEFVAFLNFLFTAILCYGFYIIRIIFKKRSTNGTIFLGLLITILFALSGSIQGLTFLNPFGYLFSEIFNFSNAFNINIWEFSLIHIIAPLLATFSAYYFINLRFGKQTNPFFKSKTRKKNS